ncbi:hypothetical protein V1478_007439 [Vespula squamosa]|uniref:Uncharacterized protein n=1 Tax=Vespula squamosa TaxID=30214 RepID=A0ABD2B3C9_VESSQ
MKSTGMISDSFPNENVRRFPLAAGNGTPEVKFRLVSPVPGLEMCKLGKKKKEGKEKNPIARKSW